MKRLIDVVGAGVLLVVFSPLLAACAIAIKLDSPGPVFYRGTRVGRGGKTFRSHKFRSMRTDADDAVHREYIVRALTDGAVLVGEQMYKLVDDDRVTRVGAFLRRWSLDELPQLLDVLHGDMSLVGPRPEVPYAVDHYEPHHMKRFDVLPGLTGLWQVSGRATLSPHDMLELDVRYATERSMLLDLNILLRTPLAVLRRVGSA
jgi:lipopolysaccharide/colanic/teichoic acid biosynthesis glycosyltransferase